MTAGTLVHTWDLARAAGIDERLDETAVLRAQQAVEPLGDAIRAGNTFGPAVEPPAGADAQTRLLCYLGRSVEAFAYGRIDNKTVAVEVVAY